MDKTNAVYETKVYTKTDGTSVEQLINIEDKLDVKYRMILFLPFIDGSLNEHKVLMRGITNVGHAFKEFESQAKEYSIKYTNAVKAQLEEYERQQKTKIIAPTQSQISQISQSAGGITLVKN